MKKLITTLVAACLALPLFAQARRHIVIPDLQGYVTLKCDFHIHTVFSDGTVWPTVRIDEAYFEGLDAISITEHLEGRMFPGDIAGSQNRAYEIALESAKIKGIILIKGAEITRNMPPGHHNAIFLSDADELVKPDWMDAFRAAKAQNAFIFYNHPYYLGYQPYVNRWHDEFTNLLEQGMMHGIEVVNYGLYSPEAHSWCLEKNLTMIGNSDIHAPIQEEIDFNFWKHRTMTLVFARSKTAEAIREALNERRTAIYDDGRIIGEEKYLKELFENAVEWDVKKSGSTANITFRNKSDLTFHLKNVGIDTGLAYFRECTIEPHGEHTVTVNFRDGSGGYTPRDSGDVIFSVENFLVQPNEGMRYTIKI